MADGTSAPKGALITGLVLILLAFGGCGYGCVSGAGLIGDVANAIDSANTTPLNQPTTLRATGENGIILTSDGSALCAVADPSGAEVTIEEPGAGTTGTLEVNGEQLDLSYVFDTDPGTTYDVDLRRRDGHADRQLRRRAHPEPRQRRRDLRGTRRRVRLLRAGPALPDHRSGQAIEVEEEPGGVRWRQRPAAGWLRLAPAAGWRSAAAPGRSHAPARRTDAAAAGPAAACSGADPSSAGCTDPASSGTDSVRRQPDPPPPPSSAGSTDPASSGEPAAAPGRPHLIDGTASSSSATASRQLRCTPTSSNSPPT